MEADAVERARARLAALRSETDGAELAATVERAREQLEALALATAELEGTLPDRVSAALHESLRSEVLPVARQLAETRGLSSQIIRRLEHLQGDLASERKARVDDLALLVDLVSSGWQSVDRRLDRLERSLDRLERALEAQPGPPGSVLRLEERR